MSQSRGPGRREAWRLHPAGKALAGWWLPLVPEDWEARLEEALADCRYPVGPVEVTAAALWRLDDWAVELVGRLPRGQRFDGAAAVAAACRRVIDAAAGAVAPLAGARRG